jgi:dynein heavy chain
LNAKLAKLNAEYKEANDEKTAAVNEADRCAKRLNLANRLVSALGSEKDRWSNSII